VAERVTYESTSAAVDVTKAPKAPEGPKVAQAGIQSPSAGTVDPVSQFSVNVQPSTPPSNSEGIVAPSQTANVSAATDGSADAPVRLAPSARNEQTPEMESLALHIAARSARGDSRFTIRLDPPELGRIEVNLSMNSHGHAQAVLAVEKPQTLDLLLRDAHGLERALKDAGLELGSNLSFSLKEEGRPTFAREHNHGPHGRAVEVVPSDKANALAALNAPLLEQLYGSRTARLDITV
jgi:flagellar hook-length control protein FliK